MYRIIPIVLLLSVGCIHLKPAPEWLVQQPVSDDGWYGIASVDMSNDNYRENARTKAIQEIASQIEIHVQSSIKSVTKEESYNRSEFELSEYYESIIEARVDIMLPEVEILDTYTKDRKYYVFTQLKKTHAGKLLFRQKCAPFFLHGV